MVRCKQQQRRYQQLRHASLCIQTRRRAIVACRRQLHAYRRLKGATRYVQARRRAIVVCRRQRSSYLRLKAATVRLQTAWRARQCRAAYEHHRMVVIRAQAMVRCKQQQRRYQSWRDTVSPATLVLQRAWRRRALRCRWHALVATATANARASRRQRCLRLCHAARLLQGLWRRNVCTAYVNLVTRAQALVRCILTRRAYAVIRRGVVRQQALFRGSIARRAFAAEREAARAVAAGQVRAAVKTWVVRVAVQRLVQQRRAELSEPLEHRAASVLQRRWRASRRQIAAQEEAQARRSAASRITAWAHARLARRRFLAKRALAMKLQALWRGYRVRDMKYTAAGLLEHWQKSHKISQVLAAVKKLEVKTEGSFMVRRMVVKAGVIPLLVSYITGSNQSGVGGHLVSHALGVLIHLCRSQCCMPAMWREPLLVPALCDFLFTHKEQYELFGKCMGLVELMQRDEARFVKVFGAPMCLKKLHKLQDYYASKMKDAQRSAVYQTARSVSSAQVFCAPATRPRSGSVLPPVRSCSMKPAEIPCRVLRPNSTDPGPSAESWLRKRKRGVDLPKPGPRPAQVMGTAAASAAAIAAGEVQAVDGLASRDAGGAAISTEAVDQGSEVATSSTTEPHVVARAAGSSRDGIRATPAPTYRVGTKRTHESEDGSATADGSPGASQSTSDSLAGQSAAAATAKTEPTWVQSKRPRLGDQEDAKDQAKAKGSAKPLLEESDCQQVSNARKRKREDTDLTVSKRAVHTSPSKFAVPSSPMPGTPRRHTMPSPSPSTPCRDSTPRRAQPGTPTAGLLRSPAPAPAAERAAEVGPLVVQRYHKRESCRDALQRVLALLRSRSSKNSGER